MNLNINEIIQDPQSGQRFRILWLDSPIVYIIDIDDRNDKALPFKRLIREIQEDLIEDRLHKIKEDPYFSIVQQTPSEINRSIRDKAWEMIKDLIRDEPQIYDKTYRTVKMKDVQKNFQISYPGLRKYLRKYWQRGKTPNALLPDYHRSGAKGQERTPSEKKRGNPRKYGGTGINVDEQVKRHFRYAIDKYHLLQKLSLTKSFEFMLKECYAADFYHENGIMKAEFENPDKLPSYRQFHYWFHKEYSSKQVLIAREGKQKYGRDHRELLSSSTSEVYGPGSRFQIDATVVNVYLISRDNPNWIIGRPILYLVADVFTRLVVGMYVGLEGPSWTGAMMALANTAMDKVQYCAEYGISIPKEAWPCENLPDVLLADRGELEGAQPERLVTAFNIHLENAAPYRPDWKGIVEKRFDVTDGKVKPFLPGYVDKDAPARGAPDYRIRARLTLEQFTQIIIKQILAYNLSHYIEDYPRSSDMIADEVEPIPIKLWNWGIENRSGKLAYHPEQLVRFHLLPKQEITVTAKGLRFNTKLFYTCDRALKEEWFVRARNEGTWKISVSYDPRNMSHLYMLDDKNDAIETCNLLPDFMQFEMMSLDEINYLIAQEKHMRSDAKLEELRVQLGFMEDAQNIMQTSVKKAESEQDKSLSKLEKTQAIRENRSREKRSRQKEETFNLRPDPLNEAAEVIPFPSQKNQNSDEGFGRPSIKDFLRSRKEPSRDE